MSEHEVQLFEAKYAVWRSERGVGLSPSDAFERFVVEQVLRDFDLSSDAAASGDLKGGDDGGVDSIYLFMNGTLITLETPALVPAGPIELHFIQAKEEKSFKEAPVTKLEAFAKDLLSYDKPVEAMTYLNSHARDAITNFRTKYNDVVMGNPHTLTVHFHYACKAGKVLGPKDKINVRGEMLKSYVKSQLSSAEVKFTLWNAKMLHESAKSPVESTVVLPCTEHFSTGDGSTVCLVKLTDYAEKLLTNSHGELQTRFLEPNVRDYQGSNIVNKQIRQTLAEQPTPGREDFWWLNNGITILADECPVNGHKAKIKNPQIVNGLQTSHEIYSWNSARKGSSDDRTILVRVVVATDEKTRSKIIKATNSQSPVSKLSLMSNEPIQESIEDRMRLYGLHYDRKKGEYRRLKKPLQSIVGMGTLAQAVIAIVLQKPDEARGRPQSYVDKNSAEVYDEAVNLDLYAAAILIDRQVEKYLHDLFFLKELSSDYVRDLRYYVSMLVGEQWGLANKSDAAVADAIKEVVKPIPVDVLSAATEKAKKAYELLGANDQIAKSNQMRENLLAR